MSLATLLVVVAFIAIGLVALIGAVVAYRVLGKVGAGLRTVEPRLAERALSIPIQLQSVRESLDQVDVQAERALWSLGKADERMDRMRVDLTAKRFASDSLRVRLLDGQLSLARLRELIRLLVRLDKIRREFI